MARRKLTAEDYLRFPRKRAALPVGQIKYKLVTAEKDLPEGKTPAELTELLFGKKFAKTHGRFVSRILVDKYYWIRKGNPVTLWRGEMPDDLVDDELDMFDVTEFEELFEEPSRVTIVRDERQLADHHDELEAELADFDMESLEGL